MISMTEDQWRQSDDVPLMLEWSPQRRILESAAFFVDASLRYPGPGGMGDFKQYQHFLPAPLLRAMVGDPFRGTSSGSA
ncbi:hypothetical protein [Aquisphaera insulae]|uniref:hypothetical protein n=1 Tax=Aquisphaera insulae TaxID=2712864 RepID=UPI0013EB59D7|nr:hypothetical protein [Aquisphaera insulae]